ncbi:hypothetical protein B7H23_07985 [Notoacmeibacter marinus]|uniref:Uncharacterized protein n=1 Tax=Notoacmeibacter marinus TaxID=1876515 RepID=A0A231V3Q7_9HYPH|nr:hypothetical protein B7H23_07985 [Notoacmeibacter marinus]
MDVHCTLPWHDRRADLHAKRTTFKQPQYGRVTSMLTIPILVREEQRNIMSSYSHGFSSVGRRVGDGYNSQNDQSNARETDISHSRAIATRAGNAGSEPCLELCF